MHSQPNAQEITTTAQRIPKPHDAAKKLLSQVR